MRWRRSAAGAAVIATLLVGAFAGSAMGASSTAAWVNRALGLQYRLAGDVPMRNAPWVGTHNSFNSVAEMGSTLSTADPNQQLNITQQLELGVRSLELDVHWTISPASGALVPVVCHAFPNHFPCSTEKTLGPVLEEVSGWLRSPANADQVLFLYLEDHLDNQTGYDTAASLIREKLGDVLYAPSPGACQRLPMNLTRDRVLAAGKRVIVVGNSPCGVGTQWPSLVFNWEKHLETGPGGFTEYPACGGDFTRAQYESTQVRYFEDARPSALSGPRITAKVATGMARCGVDLVGLDQLAPEDPRLRALVWSWASGQPARGTCAVQSARKGSLATPWKTLDCALPRRPACRRASAWFLAANAVAESAAGAECKARGAVFAVPRTGYEAQLLRKRMQAVGATQVWLGYVKRRGEWTALDRRSG